MSKFLEEYVLFQKLMDDVDKEEKEKDKEKVRDWILSFLKKNNITLNDFLSNYIIKVVFISKYNSLEGGIINSFISNCPEKHFYSKLVRIHKLKITKRRFWQRNNKRIVRFIKNIINKSEIDKKCNNWFW